MEGLGANKTLIHGNISERLLAQNASVREEGAIRVWKKRFEQVRERFEQVGKRFDKCIVK